MTLEAQIEGAVERAVRRVLREERQPASDEGGFLRLKDAAQYAGVSKTTLKDWCKAGLRVHGRGRTRLVSKAELREFIERGDAERPEPIETRAARILSMTKAR